MKNTMNRTMKSAAKSEMIKLGALLSGAFILVACNNNGGNSTSSGTTPVTSSTAISIVAPYDAFGNGYAVLGNLYFQILNTGTTPDVKLIGPLVAGSTQNISLFKTYPLGGFFAATGGNLYSGPAVTSYGALPAPAAINQLQVNSIGEAFYSSGSTLYDSADLSRPNQIGTVSGGVISQIQPYDVFGDAYLSVGQDIYTTDGSKIFKLPKTSGPSPELSNISQILMAGVSTSAFVSMGASLYLATPNALTWLADSPDGSQILDLQAANTSGNVYVATATAIFFYSNNTLQNVISLNGQADPSSVTQIQLVDSNGSAFIISGSQLYFTDMKSVTSLGQTRDKMPITLIEPFGTLGSVYLTSGSDLYLATPTSFNWLAGLSANGVTLPTPGASPTTSPTPAPSPTSSPNSNVTISAFYTLGATTYSPLAYGSSATFYFTANNASSVSLSPASGTCQTITPSSGFCTTGTLIQTTPFTLTAYGLNGPVTAAVSVNVSTQAAPSPSPSPSPTNPVGPGYGGSSTTCATGSNGSVVCGGLATYCAYGSNGSVACGGLATSCAYGSNGSVACGGASTSCAYGSNGSVACGGASTSCAYGSNGSVACGGESTSCANGSNGSVACGGESTSCANGSNGSVACGGESTSCANGSNGSVACGGESTSCANGSNGSVACGGESTSCANGSNGSVACGGESTSCANGSNGSVACGGESTSCANGSNGSVACGGAATSCATGSNGSVACGGESTSCTTGSNGSVSCGSQLGCAIESDGSLICPKKTQN